jgi:hypothetical protein
MANTLLDKCYIALLDIPLGSMVEHQVPSILPRKIKHCDILLRDKILACL